MKVEMMSFSAQSTQERQALKSAMVCTILKHSMFYNWPYSFKFERNVNLPMIPTYEDNPIEFYVECILSDVANELLKNCRRVFYLVTF